MTRPTIICFLGENGKDEQKVFIRTLLYSTSDSGLYIENMFISLRLDDTIKNFNIWAYGDNGLVRGSGLFVDKGGISSYHHFLLPKDKIKHRFEAGNYHLQVFVETVDKEPTMVFEEKLILTEQQSTALLQGDAVYYNWASNEQTYISHIDIKTR